MELPLSHSTSINSMVRVREKFGERLRHRKTSAFFKDGLAAIFDDKAALAPRSTQSRVK